MKFDSFLVSLICASLLHQYNAFRAKRREVGYSEEDLKETYGFLLFDDVNKVQTKYTLPHLRQYLLLHIFRILLKLICFLICFFLFVF